MLIASRAIYIWCLHRQAKQRGKDVKYSEMEQRPYTANTNASTAPFAGGGGGNNISLDYLRPGDRRSQVSTFSSRPSTGRPQTNSLRPVSNVNPLGTSTVQFYSPSAHPGGTVAAALGTQSSRDSTYLPPGYYLRDTSAPNNSVTSTASPRQMYNAPAASTSFLYADPSTPPIPRLSRSPTSNSISTLVTRPATGSVAGGQYGAGYPGGVGGGGGPGGSNPRPVSGYTTGQGYSQPRRTASSNGEANAGDRRSKPSQALDDLLGGR